MQISHQNKGPSRHETRARIQKHILQCEIEFIVGARGIKVPPGLLDWRSDLGVYLQCQIVRNGGNGHQHAYFF